jgi:membrane-associated PAP2 superfamily phosphatase
MTDLSAVAEPKRRSRRLFSEHRLRRRVTWARLVLVAGARPDEPVAIALAATLGLSAYFMVLPGIDMAVSTLFYSPEAGFALAAEPVLKALRKSSSLVLGVVLLGLVATAVAGVIRRRRLAGPARRAVVLLAGLALGSGLIVNSLLKSLWGRARPVQIEAFGGEADFTAAWRLSDNCASNCSFVSGEASSAAWMVGVAVLMAPAAWRAPVVAAALAYGLALSLNRIAFGGHFLSDVLLSWAITALVIAVLHRAALDCPKVVRRARRVRRWVLPA